MTATTPPPPPSEPSPDLADLIELPDLPLEGWYTPTIVEKCESAASSLEEIAPKMCGKVPPFYTEEKYRRACSVSSAAATLRDAVAEIKALLTRVSSAEAKLVVMEEALRPFAAEADNYDYGDGSGPDLEDAPDASSLNEITDLTVGDLRRARNALGEG